MALTVGMRFLPEESRTSSPLGIPRDHATMGDGMRVAIYLCGEGAGYKAGGITSAAMDGMKTAEHYREVCYPQN